MGFFHPGRQGFLLDGEAVVHRSDFDFSGLRILDGMVCAVMPEFHLRRFRAERQSQ